MIKRISVYIILILLLGVGGYFAFNSIYQKQTSLDNETINLLIKTLKNPSLVKSINIADDSPPAHAWVPENYERQIEIASKLVTYLEHATMYTSEIPKSQEGLIFAANIGPSQLCVLDTNKSSIIVSPAYYVTVQNNSINVKYIDDVVDVSSNNKHVYIKANKLYNWLKNNEWKIDYINM
ncbi:hypothetical protein [Pseudobacteroides cellulosolvens]|uniref:Uncharacterized protein n=1 Tax=Pseudobacteroides cellulosolvens ATCC 35603 = DSM 2933 TaxID=398512 RepID=A0A0L6JP87_9FIRM|nr:hypothetical protein [Pseudobacteroides cellulosolvens]KNY27177.1 hypothetical protein Bccel_2445 [Pseudobacteroides cellulosolvens ATCC 35603 = DSM 2933]